MLVSDYRRQHIAGTLFDRLSLSEDHAILLFRTAIDSFKFFLLEERVYLRFQFLVSRIRRRKALYFVLSLLHVKLFDL